LSRQFILEECKEFVCASWNVFIWVLHAVSKVNIYWSKRTK